jgi:Flp pilus assembly protein TadG
VRRRRMRDEDGAVAVEFVLLLPVLIVILFGIISFGVAFWKMEIYVSAAREGARYAAVRCAPDSTTGCTNALIASKVATAAVGYPLTPGTPTEDVVCNNTTAAAGQSVTVSWVQRITIRIPFLPDLSRNVTVRGVFRCE